MVDRKIVDYTFHQLSSSFGHAYFDATVGQDLQEEKIPWLYSLLANKDHVGCINALYHIAKMTKYLETLDASIQTVFDRYRKDPVSMRTFFFELFIFYLCDLNHIPNKKKIWEGNQELEGTMTINNKSFLYECRKTFIPQSNEIDLVRRLISQLYQSVQNITKYIPSGMIWAIRFSRPLNIKAGRYVFHFTKSVDLFIKRLNEYSGVPDIQYEHEADEGVFKAINYSEADFIEITNMKHYDIIVSQNPKSLPGYFAINITANFSIYRSKIYRKLEDAIREKKKQHEKSAYGHQIIFLDNEEFPEFNMTIIPNDNILDVKEIQRICNKMDLQAILVIVRRRYLKNGVDYCPLTFYPEHLRAEAQIIEKAIHNMNHLLAK